MSAQNNGGTAFPIIGRPEEVLEIGVSVRDYFAANAIVGVMAMVAARAHDAQKFDGSTPEDAMAIDAYRIADAMLKARSS